MKSCVSNVTGTQRRPWNGRLFIRSSSITIQHIFTTKSQLRKKIIKLGACLEYRDIEAEDCRVIIIIIITRAHTTPHHHCCLRPARGWWRRLCVCVPVWYREHTTPPRPAPVPLTTLNTSLPEWATSIRQDTLLVTQTNMLRKFLCWKFLLVV